MKEIYETERLVLRTFGDSEKEAQLVLDYFQRNKDHLSTWDPLRSEKFYTIESRQKVLTWELDEMKKGCYLRFWIFKKDDKNFKKVIGTIGFSNIKKEMSCSVGYSMDKDEINKGFITEGVKCAINIVVNEYNLNTEEATIMPNNKCSLRVAEKLGFTYEGIFEKYQQINGKMEDHMHMVLKIVQ